MTTSQSQAPIPLTRIERMLSAKNALPEDLQNIFDDLFLLHKTDEQVIEDRQLTVESFTRKHNEMLRSLRAVVLS